MLRKPLLIEKKNNRQFLGIISGTRENFTEIDAEYVEMIISKRYNNKQDNYDKKMSSNRK